MQLSFVVFVNTDAACSQVLRLTGVAADGGVVEHAEALAALVSTARSYWIRRS